MKKIPALLLLATLLPVHLMAQDTLSLEQCRRMALENNKSLQIANEKVYQAEQLRKSAADQFLPKVSANAVALFSEKEINLISDEKQNRINHIGDEIVQDVATDLQNSTLGSIPIVGSPIVNAIANSNMMQNIATHGNEAGQNITDGLKTDTRQMYAIMFGATQPVYLGGKLRALYQIAKANETVSALKYDKATEEMKLKVDEAYWRVVSVDQKLELAQEYYNLLDTLTNNVALMVEEGVATMGDLLKVQVKKNEAQMTLAKAQNGAVLSRMALAQLCGLPLHSPIVLSDRHPLSNPLQQAPEEVDMNEVWANRTEMKMLDQAALLAKAEKKAAVSCLLPNVVANGGYMMSNPNLFNGFDKTFGGMFYGAIVVNVPICHTESFHAINLAKSKAREVQMQREEAQEMINLQITQLDQKRWEAYLHYAQAASGMSLAEENMKLASEGFAAGMASASDLLGAQTAWMQAKSEMLDAEIEMKMCTLYLNSAKGMK